MSTQSSFPELFGEYYAIHETISVILRETSDAPMDVNYVVRRVKEAHPELDMDQ